MEAFPQIWTLSACEIGAPHSQSAAEVFTRDHRGHDLDGHLSRVEDAVDLYNRSRSKVFGVFPLYELIRLIL